MRNFVRTQISKVFKKHVVMSKYDELRFAVLEHGYKFFEEGDYNLNIIFERTSDIITNYFTDYMHILYKVNGEKKIITIDATTKPGIKGSIDSPITYEGITGTAIIIPNQYRSSFKFVEGYNYKPYPFNVPYFEQIKGLSYWRDGNKDLVIDEVQEQDNKVFRTHIHNMSNPNKKGFPINNWSKGCMGYEEPNFKVIEPVIRESIKRYGNVFTVTILQSY